MSADLSVNFLAAKVDALSRSKAISDAKKIKPPRGHQDNNVPLFILEGLSQDQADHVSSLSAHTRALILSDLSQIHGIANPVRGYLLIEKIAVSVCRILNKKLVDALELPPWKKSMGGRGIPKLPNHSQRDLVEKLYEGLMETVFKKCETGEYFLPKSKTPNKRVTFQTYWRDNFLLYRRFVYTYACACGIKYTNAVQKCASIGRKMATTKQQISDVIATLEKKGKIGNSKEERYIGEMSDKDNNYLEDDLEKFVASGLNDDEDPEYKAEIGDVFKAVEQLVTKRKARLKKERKRSRPQQTRGSRPSKRRTNSQLATQEGLANDALQQDLPTENPIKDVPVFDIGKCIDPTDEWLVLEVPHLPDEDLGIPKPELIPGPDFVPPGSEDLRAVLFVRVTRCFAYTMERADLIFHGQV